MPKTEREILESELDRRDLRNCPSGGDTASYEPDDVVVGRDEVRIGALEELFKALGVLGSAELDRGVNRERGLSAEFDRRPGAA